MDFSRSEVSRKLARMVIAALMGSFLAWKLEGYDVVMGLGIFVVFILLVGREDE